MTQLVVLCGGYGNRMRSIVGQGQKCMVPVAGRPFLSHVLRVAAGWSIDEVLLLAGHRAEEVDAFAHAVPPARFTVAVRAESRPAGTIAALREAADDLEDAFLLSLGDVLPPTGQDWWTVLSATASHTGAAAVMTTAPEAASMDSGNITVADPWITRYDKTAPAPLIDRGLRYVSKPSLEEYGGSTDAEFFGALAADRRLAHVFVDQPIVEVGTPERWARANAALSATGAES